MRFVLRLLPFVAAACGATSDRPPGEQTEVPTTAIAQVDAGSNPDAVLTPCEVTDVVVSTGTLLARYSEAPQLLEVSSLGVGLATTITVVGDAGATVRIGDDLVETNTEHPVTISCLADGCGVPIVHLARNGARIGQRVVRPNDFPKYDVTGVSGARGRIFLAVFGANKSPLPPYLLVLDESGAPLFYRRLAAKGYDFKWHSLPSGAVRYSYQSEGKTVVLDEAFRPLRELALLPNAGHDALPVELHEFLMFDDDHYVLSAELTKEVTNVPPALAGGSSSSWVIGEVLQEVSAGKVLFEWSSLDHPELYSESVEGNDFATSTIIAPADYIHFNSLFVDADGDWVVSLRHFDAVLKIHKPDGTIAWTLGGKADDFALTGPERFSHQHFAHFLPEGPLLLFDNGNANEATRVVELGLDQANHTVTSFHVTPTGRYSSAMGSVQKQSAGTYFVGWGAVGLPAPAVSEIDRETGATTFAIEFRDPYWSYRGVKKLD